MSSFLTGVLGEGPAATAAIYTPDLDHFRGSFGGKHVIPLWRNAAATEPNITAGLLPLPNEVYTERVTLEDIFAYVYAVLANPEYTEHFSEELSEPGPQLPLTKDSALFRRATTMGKRLLWLHTSGEGSFPKGCVPGRYRGGRRAASKEFRLRRKGIRKISNISRLKERSGWARAKFLPFLLKCGISRFPVCRWSKAGSTTARKTGRAAGQALSTRYARTGGQPR